MFLKYVMKKLDVKRGSCCISNNDELIEELEQYMRYKKGRAVMETGVQLPDS